MTGRFSKGVCDGAPTVGPETRVAPSTPRTKPSSEITESSTTPGLLTSSSPEKTAWNESSSPTPAALSLLAAGRVPAGMASGPTSTSVKGRVDGSAPGSPSSVPAGGLNAMFGKLCAKTGVSAGVAVNDVASAAEWKNRPDTLPSVSGWSVAASTRTSAVSSVGPKRSSDPGDVQETFACALVVPALASVAVACAVTCSPAARTSGTPASGTTPTPSTASSTESPSAAAEPPLLSLTSKLADLPAVEVSAVTRSTSTSPSR